MDNKLKVLFIAGRVSVTNGAYHSLLNNARELKKLGVVPIVLLHTHGAAEKGFLENHIDCRVLPYSSCTVPADNPSKIKGMVKELINFVLEPFIYRIIKKEHIDIVHINVSTASLGAVSAIRTNTPLVWHLREFLEDDVNLTYINRKKTVALLRKADKVIAISDAVSQHFRNEYRIKNIITVYNGIYAENTLPVKQRAENEHMNLVLVGRIVKTKGQLEALKAVKKLHDQGYVQLSLLLVGDVGDQDYYNSLRRYIESADMEAFVTIKSHQKNLVPVWEKADAALVCSTREGFGRVTAEFMLNGVPVIGADTGGTPELLRDGRGLIYKYGDENDLVRKIKYAADNYGDMIKMAQKAKDYAEHNFTAIQCAEKIRKVYGDVLERKKSKE